MMHSSLNDFKLNSFIRPSVKNGDFSDSARSFTKNKKNSNKLMKTVAVPGTIERA